MTRCTHEQEYFYQRAQFHESQHFNADRAGAEAVDDLADARPICYCDQFRNLAIHWRQIGRIIAMAFREVPGMTVLNIRFEDSLIKVGGLLKGDAPIVVITGRVIMPMRKQYLGDGAYSEFDGAGVTLTTEDGISVTNTVYLESDVLAAFLKMLPQHFKLEWLKEQLNG